jgi:hypothetical protein
MRDHTRDIGRRMAPSTVVVMARTADSSAGGGASARGTGPDRVRTGGQEDPAEKNPAGDGGSAAEPGAKPRPRWAVGPSAASAAGGAGARRVSAFRSRILPRSLLGVASLILAFAIGAGFSGVVLYSYYQYKLNQTDQRVNGLINGYKTQFTNAEADLNAAVAAAKANIAAQLKTVQEQQTSPSVLAALIRQVAPSVFFVHTLDASGQPSVGTAFVVSSNSSDSLLLTSYTTVAAATHSPGPPVYVKQGNGSDVPVTVRTWDPQYDLALLVLPRGGLPKLVAASNNPNPVPGDHLFAVSGLASSGAKVTQGTVIDVSAAGVQVDAGIGSEFQGGPLVAQNGQVVAVASRTYSPLGFTTDGVWYVPYVEAACNKVLSCPGGSLVGSH